MFIFFILLIYIWSKKQSNRSKWPKTAQQAKQHVGLHAWHADVPARLAKGPCLGLRTQHVPVRHGPFTNQASVGHAVPGTISTGRAGPFGRRRQVRLCVFCTGKRNHCRRLRVSKRVNPKRSNGPTPSPSRPRARAKLRRRRRRCRMSLCCCSAGSRRLLLPRLFLGQRHQARRPLLHLRTTATAAASSSATSLSPQQQRQVSLYVDALLDWNQVAL